ncbi:MAG: hypothetical protein ACHP7H_01340 [Hyphomicrobiales bacterium]
MALRAALATRNAATGWLLEHVPARELEQHPLTPANGLHSYRHDCRSLDRDFPPLHFHLFHCRELSLPAHLTATDKL